MNLELRRALGLASCFCLTMASLVVGQEKRALKPEDVVDIRTVSDVQISADGRWVAFVVTEPADPAKPQKARDTNIWVVPADGSRPARPFAASPKSDTHPRWSPDGHYLAFLSDRGEPIGDLPARDGNFITDCACWAFRLRWSPIRASATASTSARTKRTCSRDCWRGTTSI